MPELGSYGSVRGARGNSRPYRESGADIAKPTRLTRKGHCWAIFRERPPPMASDRYGPDKAFSTINYAEAATARLQRYGRLSGSDTDMLRNAHTVELVFVS